MKVKNLNNSSKKTKKLIKKIFAEMLCEKKELGNITVSELCNRAEISRGTFYTHYDDIYGVAEDYENELINTFFRNNAVQTQNIYDFIDYFFEYIRKNDENYRLLCKSNDFIFAAKKLADIACKNILELCYANKNIKNYDYIEFDIAIFLEGILCEYVRYCRGYSSKKLDDLYIYTKYWVNNFIKNRS